MGRFDVLTQLDKKPTQTTPLPEKSEPVRTIPLQEEQAASIPATPQDSKDTRVQETKTPRGKEVKQPSIQDSLTPRLLDPKGSRPQEVKRTRIIKTHSYEFYVDQVERIRDIAYEDKKKGGKGSASQFVRDAIDEYLHKKGQK